MLYGAFTRITLALAIVLPLAAVAGENAASATYPPVLRDMVDAGELQVVKQFATDKDGLTGYIVKRDGYQTVVYSEGGYLILGPLYGPNGVNLSKRYARQHAPSPDVGQAMRALDRRHLIGQGPDDAPTLVVFADPDCLYCHRLYRQVQPLVRAGRLRVEWAMVGVLGPDSTARAAAILAAADPAAALARNEAGFNGAREQGGVAPLADPDEALTAVLSDHRQTMLALGGTGTPTLAFRERGQWIVKVGVPPAGWLGRYARSP